MNKIDFTRPGGFPLIQDTLGFLQKAYTDSLQGICSILGEKVILSGCEEENGKIGPGVVAVNGEILPTPGGSDTTVFIEEVKKSVTFRDTSVNDAYFTRTLQFGVGENTMDWKDFLKLSTLKDMQILLNNLPSFGGVPKGTIVMWAGKVPPEGWALCDGENGPDLRGCFVAGYHPEDPDYSTIKYGGGKKEVKLEEGQLGWFYVDTDAAEEWQGVDHTIRKTHILKMRINDEIIYDNTSKTQFNESISIKDAHEAHENRPPYYVLAYIIKL
ncbi:MAG: phage tail protein [Bacteroidales bacterium]|nr:phage tail protein [Bacteroidales bacterium]